MKYRESKLDSDLRKWFTKDLSKALLRRIQVTRGNLRGVAQLDAKIDFPISAFCGANGAGKSTILAWACCAYHNNEDGFKLPKRRTAYYTFSDFFIQHASEQPLQDIEIRYWIAHDSWRKSENAPDGRGIRYQIRRKKMGGKWTDYDMRVKKTAIFLGIQRIVPHAERSQARSYSRAFAGVPLKGWESKVRDAVGFVLGRKYEGFRYLEHSTYSLPLVKRSGQVYSGFNMGAGENALFEIFSTIYSCGGNAMLAVDELELGLHVGAQRRFVERLKHVCLETKTQVVCTTHSKDILDCLPNEARFFIETGSGKSLLTCGIASEFAFSKLGALGQKELDVFVEDEVARSIVQAALSAETRSRITIVAIGSASAMSRQLAALYMRNSDRPAIAVFDGDQRLKEPANKGVFLSGVEKDAAEAEAWFSERVCYLPGDTWPEKWLLLQSENCQDDVAHSFSLNESNVPEVIESGIQAGKHSEFHAISEKVSLSKSQCLQKFAEIVVMRFPEEFSGLRNSIATWLDASDSA